MFSVTKTTFKKVKSDFEQYHEKSFEKDFSAESLSKVFSENLNISSQSKAGGANKTEKSGSNKSTRKSARSPLSTPMTVPPSTIPIHQLVTLDEEVSLNVDEVDFIESSQKPTRQLGRPRKNAKSPAAVRGESSRKAKRSPLNMSKSTEPLLTQELVLDKSPSKDSNKSGDRVVAGTSKDSNETLPASQSTEKDYQSPWDNVVPDSVPIMNKTILLPESPLASQSHTVNSTEEVVIEQYRSSQSTNSDDQSQRSNITVGTANSQLNTLLTKTTSEDKLKRICKVTRETFSKRYLINKGLTFTDGKDEFLSSYVRCQ